MKQHTSRKWLMAAIALAMAAAMAAPMACSSSTPPRARAFKIETREQLVGGQRALGEVGDFKITNGIIHAVVQDVGHSRGFGAFGGSLIDIDLAREGKTSGATGVKGNDQFTEMFPAFFLEAMEPQRVSVERDGSDGGAAVILVEGDGSQFLSLAKSFNELVLNGARLSYQIRYILEPGKSYVKAEVAVLNNGAVDVGFPIDVPVGYITLLGASQKLFVPGKAGYDMRFRLDEVYRRNAGLNALPGEISSMVATEGHGISYAFGIDPKGATYVQNKIDPTTNQPYYPDVEPDSMLIPLAYSSFLGTYWGKLPGTLKKGQSYKYSSYLAVGTGDVSSAMKVMWDLKEKKVGRVSGRVFESGTRQELADVKVVLQDAEGNFVTSARTRDNGVYVAWAPPGRYRAIAVDDHRTSVFSATDEKDYFELGEDQTVSLDVVMDRAATLSVNVMDEKGRPLPAKVSVEATSPTAQPDGAKPWTYLYNLRIGESRRATDFIHDGEDPSTRRYLETFFFVNGGRGGTHVRPGEYTVHVSRGIEYDVASVPVKLAPGQETQIAVTLKHVVKTPGWASGDFHVHSVNSVDSSMALDQRVLSFAAEGVDYIASTDHNYVSDFQPIVEGMRLENWLATSVGIELTTLEMGHFNAWPIKFEPGPVTHGAFNWFRKPPAEIFGKLRSMSKHGPENMLVQVNHPRDTIMGYFNAFNVSSYQARSLPPSGFLTLDQEPQGEETTSPYQWQNFSTDFDVIEIFNGKRQDLLRHYRVPQNPPPGPDPTVAIPPPGTILEERVPVEEGVDCSKEPADSVKCIQQPVYPGGLDDYYAFISRGKRLTGVGNSDSHDESDEAGLPRTYLKVGATADGTMKAFDERAAVTALKSQQVFVTNGPIIDFTVNGEGPGARVVQPDGKVRLKVRVLAAQWVDVSRVRLVRGWKNMPGVAETVAEWSVAPVEGTACEKPDCLRFETELVAGEGAVPAVADESFLTVEVEGSRSMWPVYTPYEVPSIAIGEAVGAIGSAFGFSDKYGRYKPLQTQAVTPYAFTNPVWVDHTVRQGLTAKKLTAVPLGPDGEQPPTRHIRDLRKLLGAFHGE